MFQIVLSVENAKTCCRFFAKRNLIENAQVRQRCRRIGLTFCILNSLTGISKMTVADTILIPKSKGFRGNLAAKLAGVSPARKLLEIRPFLQLSPAQEE